MKNKKEKRPGSWKRVALTVLCVILALILVVLVGCTIYVEYLMGLMQRDFGDDTTISQEQFESIHSGETEDPNSLTAPTVNPGDVTWGNVQEIQQSENIVNILLVGQDARPGEGRARSDAMILCTFNKANKTLTLTSFLRDSYVNIPGYYATKLNAAYAAGGFKLLDATLKENFGLNIDGNVEVNFTRFSEVVEVLGGVDIELTQREADHLNKGSGYAWSLTAGVNHLNGEQALAYARIRALDDDWGRTNRQRNVITAAVEQVRNCSLAQLNTLLTQILPLITTDMTDSEIIGYVADLFPMLAGCEIVTQHVPADGTWYYATIDYQSMIVLDLEQNRQFLQDTLGE